MSNKTGSRARASNAPAGQSVGDTIAWGKGTLEPSPSSGIDAQLLMAHVLERDRPWVLANRDAALSPAQFDSFQELIGRRQGGEPVAYLRGFVEWFDVRLIVTPAVLVPRPETELLAERAIRLVRSNSMTTAADIGTGSGAIAIALARHCPAVRVTGVDRSENALRVARANIDELGLGESVALRQGNLVEPLSGAPEIILANLPYLSWSMWDEVDRDVRHEPMGALVAGETGLELYEQLLVQFHSRQWGSTVILEIDPSQARGIRDLVDDILPGRSTRIEQDYSGHNRIVVVSGDGD